VIYLERNIPVEKNKEYSVEIIGLGHEGEGVGKVEDFTVFVTGALPGETVEAKIIKVSKNFAVGKLVDITKQSSNRVIPLCDMHKRCGGCQLLHASYEFQLELKTKRVEETIKRIGKIEDFIIHPIIGMDNPYRYRNKVQLPVGKKDGKVQIGFYAPRSHDIIDMDTCLIQDESADKVIALTRKWIEKYNISPYDEAAGLGIVRHIMIRKGFKTGEVMVVIVTNGKKLPYSKEFIDLMVKNIEGLKSIIQNINSLKTNVILGKENITLWGCDVITDYIGKFKFNISPLSFFQVNPVQTEVLYGKALEYAELKGEEVVFDAYCGAGTISLFLAQKAKKVYGVEIIPQAIENANENVKENGVNNAEFIVGESEKVIPDLINKGIKPDVVVVDPPRKGCERELLEAIASVKPERIVYVSCDPGTLARDLGILDELGYRTVEAQPVDMFPHTAHVETVVLISRQNP
jgi:23S rRNA (uracil1939-C5)-methyltransferase